MLFQRLIIAGFILLSNVATSQCTYALVEHLSGTATVGCTDVAVVTTGDAGTASFCGEHIWLGMTQTSTITYTFSTPITGFKVNVERLNSIGNGQEEELQIDVNNNFYPLTAANAGTTFDCDQLAGIVPPGVVRGITNVGGSMEGITVNEPNITSVKLTLVQGQNTGNGVFVSFFICCGGCATDAGVITPSAPLSFCVPNPASFPAATQTFLESGDLLQYILFTNPADTLGSIVAISNTPSFTFGPPLQLNTTYYGAAIAGNNLNGNVDLNDPCLDISNAIEIEWKPLPSVSFTVANPEVCAGDCLTFNVTFTGTPPFSLTYTFGDGGNQTQNFATNTGTLVVCPPAGTPPGMAILEAVDVSDENCLCE